MLRLARLSHHVRSLRTGGPRITLTNTVVFGVYFVDTHFLIPAPQRSTSRTLSATRLFTLSLLFLICYCLCNVAKGPSRGPPVPDSSTASVASAASAV